MKKDQELSDKIWQYECSTPFFSRFKEFESHEAWDWYIRGMPEGEYKFIKGLLGD